MKILMNRFRPFFLTDKMWEHLGISEGERFDYSDNCFRQDKRLIEYVENHPEGTLENYCTVVVDIPDKATDWYISNNEYLIYVFDGKMYSVTFDNDKVEHFQFGNNVIEGLF